MSQPLSRAEGQAIIKWGQRNRALLRSNYTLEYVAYSADQLLAHGKDLDSVMAAASEAGEPFLIDWINRRDGDIQILNIR